MMTPEDWKMVGIGLLIFILFGFAGQGDVEYLEMRTAYEMRMNNAAP